MKSNELLNYIGKIEINDFGVPVPLELIKRLTEDYSVEINRFMDILAKASLQEREEVYPIIFEILYIMAEYDDVKSINNFYRFCPTINRTCYYNYDQTLPLGAAIQHQSYGAIQAFLKNGVDVESATMDGQSAMSFAVNENTSDDIIGLLMLEGAEITFGDIFATWIISGNSNFGMLMVDSKQMDGDLDSLLISAEHLKNTGEWGGFKFNELGDIEKKRFSALIKFIKMRKCEELKYGS